MHFLVPIDGSEAAFRAVEFAAKLAGGRSSKLTIFAVRQYIVGRHMVAAFLSKEEVDVLLVKAKDLATGTGIKRVSVVQLDSRDVSHAIVSYAEQHKVDLVVMGASGIGGFKAFLIGSISTEVLKKSICPVAIVH
jgi:nucleotide-binding universal stress UspA family protein